MFLYRRATSLENFYSCNIIEELEGLVGSREAQGDILMDDPGPVAAKSYAQAQPATKGTFWLLYFSYACTTTLHKFVTLRIGANRMPHHFNLKSELNLNPSIVSVYLTSSSFITVCLSCWILVSRFFSAESCHIHTLVL